jgi:hypothetical protein
MFPLAEVKTTPDTPVIPVSPSRIFSQPTVGPHLENYTIYRKSELPAVLGRMVQRGAAVIGVDENTLRSSIRWLEQKLNNWRTRNGEMPREEPAEAMIED